jgi:hypothetical protein
MRNNESEKKGREHIQSLNRKINAMKAKKGKVQKNKQKGKRRTRTFMTPNLFNRPSNIHLNVFHHLHRFLQPPRFE